METRIKELEDKVKDLRFRHNMLSISVIINGAIILMMLLKSG